MIMTRINELQIVIPDETKMKLDNLKYKLQNTTLQSKGMILCQFKYALSLNIHTLHHFMNFCFCSYIYKTKGPINQLYQGYKWLEDLCRRTELGNW